MGTRIAALVCFLISNALWSAEASSPVVLWTIKRIGDGNVESNLNEFTPTQFADLVAWKSEHGNIPVIAFGLDSLSLEDLTPQGGIGASEPFRKLRRITDASAETLLFPAVQSASDAISILERKGFDVIQINAGDPLPRLENPSTILVIMDKPSINMDDEILRVFSKYTLDFPNLVGMLWGKQSTWSEEPEEEANEIMTRRKRQADNNTDLFVFNDQKGLLLVFREVKLTLIKGSDRNSANFSRAVATTDTSENDRTILTLTFPNSTAGVSTTEFILKMTLTKGKLGYWKMNNVTVSLSGKDSKAFSFPPDTLLSSAVDLTVPIKKSFHCSRFGSLYPLQTQQELGQNQTFTIDIKGFQIQAFMDGKEDVFATEYECVGFFTPGIWCGIFVTIILLSILTWGMYMIMDVKTMDRFDDPKGKPISFGSGE